MYIANINIQLSFKILSNPNTALNVILQRFGL